MRKTIRTMEVSPYQLLGSDQLTLTSAPGSDRRLNTKQKPMRTASGCRFLIAFGKASAQAPPFMYIRRFMKFQNMLKADI